MSEYIVHSDRIRRMGNTIEAMRPVVEAACDYVDLIQELHHAPVSEERRIKTRATLYNAVIDYQESKL